MDKPSIFAVIQFITFNVQILETLWHYYIVLHNYAYWELRLNITSITSSYLELVKYYDSCITGITNVLRLNILLLRSSYLDTKYKRSSVNSRILDLVGKKLRISKYV